METKKQIAQPFSVELAQYLLNNNIAHKWQRNKIIIHYNTQEELFKIAYNFGKYDNDQLQPFGR